MFLHLFIDEVSISPNDIHISKDNIRVLRIKGIGNKWPREWNWEETFCILCILSIGGNCLNIYKVSYVIGVGESGWIVIRGVISIWTSEIISLISPIISVITDDNISWRHHCIIKANAKPYSLWAICLSNPGAVVMLE